MASVRALADGAVGTVKSQFAHPIPIAVATVCVIMAVVCASRDGQDQIAVKRDVPMTADKMATVRTGNVFAIRDGEEMIARSSVVRTIVAMVDVSMIFAIVSLVTVALIAQSLTLGK